MHPQPLPVHNRRLLDQQTAPTAALTITRAQLAEAVRRVMQCETPAITQGIWNVLVHETQQAGHDADQLRQAAMASLDHRQPADAPVVVVEGLRTAATIREITGAKVVVAPWAKGQLA